MKLLETKTADFPAAFATLIGSKRETQAEVGEVVAGILGDIAKRGDAALLELTQRFDWPEASLDRLRVTEQEIEAASAKIPAEMRDAFSHAARRITAYHEKQKPADARWVDEDGITLGWRWTALDSVGLYVPGGTAALSSSVLMNALPAKIAGVGRLVMTCPTPGGHLDPATLFAAKLAGVDEIWRVGGAQAIGALAYGTKSIRPVDKIVGPGNAYVAAAKRQVFGTVGIDMIAGPSEILVVADRDNDPSWIAADLLSQCEHDVSSAAILITDDIAFGKAVIAAADAHLATLARREVASRAWSEHGAVIVVPNLADAPALVDQLAPEHLELAVADPDALAARIRHAGAIFLGRHSPEAIGDYIAGANHVLPTARSARFSSGLSTLDFMKRSSIIGCPPNGLAAIGPDAVRMAQAEALPAHALSIQIRMNQ